ncbi:NUDIX domain protein [Roseisalinus antarcticus]|uniref:NUDIX domain protein n=2 Tax=Roseisalinus antarcticus TaxID=254357 RepID=A0A1Y5S2N5_9RHOB|nr:NUDIX hydrolase [Roseisalinus antarcticus]SLN28280.1 NUDIX domain protein [Roseisalinus antarcticus]
MGQRGAAAAFMPSKYVFPGGAVDPGDASVPLAAPLTDRCSETLARESAVPPGALAAAAIRELWEETGQILGRPTMWPDAPLPWTGFAATGHGPDAAPLRFIFRAITPPGPPRRFDARFFLADAGTLASDPDDFSRAQEELSNLHWVPLAEAHRLDLPFITTIALDAVRDALATPDQPARIPFYRNGAEESAFARLTRPDPER